MDVNFTNVFEGTRQYFQGLPKASPKDDGSQSDSNWHNMGEPNKSGSRPPSNVPMPESDRPSSEALIEPEPHIIHKATVMQQAQQKHSFINLNLERPSSANMISPPTHIIHKPRYTDQETNKEEPRIPPHFAVDANYQKPSSVPPVQNKYSSHLPTPPQPSIHNSPHFHSRLSHPVQQRSLTVLQTRPVSRPAAYPRSYPAEAAHLPADPKVSTYQSYDISANQNDSRRMIPEQYLHKQPIPTHSQKPLDPLYSRTPQGYNYRSTQPEPDKNSMKGYSPTVQLASRDIPMSKASLHSNLVQSRQCSYGKVSTHTQSLYHRSHSHYSVSNSAHPVDNAQVRHMPPHAYDYNRIPHKPSEPTAPVYQERITLPERNALHHNMRPHPVPPELHYPRIPTSHHSTKIPTEYSNLKPTHHYTTANHYPVSSGSAPGYPAVVQSYQPSASNVKHPYEAQKATARPLSAKQNMSMHQPRQTVSVTSLVNQMNARQQQPVPRQEHPAPVSKSKKESPLDLSVKTVRIPADSTAQDEVDYDKRDHLPALPSNALTARQQMPPKMNTVVSSSHKVDFLPNFNAAPPDKYHRDIYHKKVSQYEQYLKNSNLYGYKPPEVQYRYDAKLVSYGSQSYSRRIEPEMPKIDLTLDNDTPDRVPHREDNRKRESPYNPNAVPNKIPRYENWNNARPEHPRAVIQNHYKVNGTSTPHPKAYPDMHKRSENESYKYMQYQHEYYKKMAVQQNYEYEKMKQDTYNYSAPPADKKILSLLRNSLEAKNSEQKAVDNSDDCIIIQSDDNSTNSTDFREIKTKKARSLEYQNDYDQYKVHVPRAVDSIKYESESPKAQKLPNDIDPSLDNSVGSSDHSQSSEIDMAGARIRTKAELKGFTQSHLKKKSEEKAVESNESKTEPHRRRLFSRSDSQSDKNSTSVIRNSFESVFDFQDSGSEAETIRRPLEPVVKVERDIDDDPFWTETCDKFLEQLQNGKAKRVRRKKSPPPDKLNLDLIKIERTPVINIVDIIKSEGQTYIKSIKEEYKSDKQSSDSSDEDQPLKVLKDSCDVKKKDMRTPKKKLKTRSNGSAKYSSSDDEVNLCKVKKENLKYDSDYNASDSESDNTSLKLKRNAFLKALEDKSTKLSLKDNKKCDKFVKGKKTGFGDGSDFRPGWQEEVYRYKRSLRMPDRLIHVSKPPHWSRVSSSLPDLDPCPNSPALSSSTEELFNQRLIDKSSKDIDSDAESTLSLGNRRPNYDSEASCSTIISLNGKKVTNRDKSFVDILIQKYGKKDSKKKLKGDLNPKVIPKSDNPIELLATPSLEMDKTVSDKRNTHPSKEKVMQDLYYVGSFRSETVSNFRNAFIDNTDGLLGATQEFSPVVLKSRTRTETRVMKQRATIREVFGDERPASAPPVPYVEKEPEPGPEPEPIEEPKLVETDKTKLPIKKVKKDSISLIREGLRSSRLLKKSDAKGRLLRMKKRNNFLKLISNKKLKSSFSPEIKIKKEPTATEDGINKSTEEKSEEDPTRDKSEAITIKKVYRRLFPRRKLSSGFDYIRKKKKQIKRDETVRKRSALSRPSPESVHDVQREIKAWIINKSVGESVLHRAARLGYTDCVAYCLEKMDIPPSIRDNAGYTPLHEACSRGHLDIARLLLQYGANVSEAAQGGIRPLHEACENDYIEIMRLLLSYGADPVLATYSGQTPISLSSGKTARFLQLYLNDLHGNIPQPWKFNGPCKLFDPVDSGYDPLAYPPPTPPSPPPPSSMEFITTTAPLPPLYRLKPSNHSNTADNTQDSGLWCLLQDLSALLQVKSRDALLKQIHCGPGPPRDSLKELRMQEFLDRAQCQQLMSAGEKINIRASKIALVRYTEKVKQLLNIETVLVR